MRRREPDRLDDAAREDAERRADEAQMDAEYLAALGVNGTISGTGTALTAPTFIRPWEETADDHMAEVAEYIAAEMPDPDRLMDLPPRKAKFHPTSPAEGRDG